MLEVMYRSFATASSCRAGALFTASCLAAGVSALALGVAPSPDRQQANAPESEVLRGQLKELPQTVREISSLRVDMEPVHLAPNQSSQKPISAAASSCPTETFAYTNASFDGGSYILQGGFPEEATAAISITLTPDDFPLRVDSTEMIFGTQNTSVTTTTKWSMLVWEGTPDTGTLVAEFSSDDVILPHLVIPPGTNGVNVMVSVDPDDPEQIIVQNDGSNTFSIGYRIDEHNNQTQDPCNFFTPPPSSSNAFPATDTGPLSAPTNNWIESIDCGSGPLVCVPGGDFITFQDTICTPSGDWVMRATYTPLNCPVVFGACCLPDGSCEVMDNIECDNLNGQFQGENVTCSQITCPEPLGACCLSGNTCAQLTAGECQTNEGVWLGPAATCLSCEQINGACCFDEGQCIDFTPFNCITIEGEFQGEGTSCITTNCSPSGACCLGDGSCVNDVSPEECDDLEGTFQGDGTLCGEVTCPLPTGACCLANGNCIVVNNDDCIVVGGDWAGMDTSCEDTTGSGTADICDTSPPCPADITGPEDVPDGHVDVFDLLAVIGQWGECNDIEDCPADITGPSDEPDGQVDVFDLLAVIGQWGKCPE